jgi:hypothetical protein
VGRGAAGAAPAAGTAGSPRFQQVLRILCHLAAEVPVAVVVAADLARGWRPVFDDAAIALRSWAVFSSHSPLVGHTLFIPGPAVYGLGPLENWVISVPVRVDPAHGALWGAALACVLAIAACIQAAWSAGGPVAGATASGSVLVLLATRPDIALNLAWNPALGVLCFMAAITAAWATAAGRRAWWPVAVLAASVAAQCHELFALPAAALCVVSGALGLATTGGTGLGGGSWLRRHAWLVWGLVVGAIVWAAPLAQEVTGSPGNLTLLWRSAHQPVATFGAAKALSALGAAVRPYPEWWHIPVRSTASASFLAIAATFGGPAGWAVAVLAALAVVAVLAWRTGRRPLGSLAAIVLVAAGCTVASVAAVPTSGYLTFGYLSVIWWPIGMAVWAVLLWAVAEGVIAVMRRRRLPLPSSASATTGTTVVACCVLAGLSVHSIVTDVPLAATTYPTTERWSTVHTSERAAAAVARVAPRGPFTLRIQGGTVPSITFATLTGATYQLRSEGLDPYVRGEAVLYFGGWTRAQPWMPTVTIHLSPDESFHSVTVTGAERSR